MKFFPCPYQGERNEERKKKSIAIAKRSGSSVKLSSKD